MIETSATIAAKRALIRSQAGGQSAFDAVVAAACNTAPRKGVSIDELQAMNCKNSHVITLEVTNNTGGDVLMILGTPLGDPAESGNYAALLASIGTVATEITVSPLVTDNLGLGATFIIGMNQRFRRNPIFVNDIKVVTSDDAQRQERVSILEVPYNSASDSRVRAGEFIPVDTEFTGISIANQGAVIGEFYGLIYKLKNTILVQFNIEIAAHAVPTFKSCN